MEVAFGSKASSVPCARLAAGDSGCSYVQPLDDHELVEAWWWCFVRRFFAGYLEVVETILGEGSAVQKFPVSTSQQSSTVSGGK